MSVKSLRVTVPPGMEAALEGLARAVLKEQPEDIYLFAADHFEQLVKKRDSAGTEAHNSGISPSSTQESNSKQPVSEDGTRPVQEERSITEEPESNDTSYGVEATAVRTLAATTGTVAILGTTAKTEKKGEDGEDGKSSNSATPVVVETIPEEQEEPPINVEKAVIHEENKVEKPREEEKLPEVNDITEEETKEEPSSKSGSRPNSKNVEEISDKNETNVETEKEIPSSASTEVKEDTSLSTSPAETNKSPVSDSNKSETVSPNTKSPVIINEETESKKDVEISPELAGNESVKDKEEDVSKSISSERLKTNSISNTTLSSDSIVEFDNNSVKQSPSTDKVIESFDSSSTVEFVDTATKEILKLEGNKSNPARSISSDLSNKANLPLDGEKTPDVLSPEDQEQIINDEPLPSPPPALEEEEVLETPMINDNAHNYKSPEKEVLDSSSKVSIESQNGADSSLKDYTQNDEASLNSEISLNLTNSVPTVVQNESHVQEMSSKGTPDNSSSNDSVENNKAESGSLLSSDNNSSLNDNGETASSPVTAVNLTPAPVSLESPEGGKGESGLSQNHSEEVKSDIIESNHQLLENHKAGVENVTKENESTNQKVVENIKEELKLSKIESIFNDSIESNPKVANSLGSRSETPNNHAVEKSLKEVVMESSNVEIKNNLEKIVNGLSDSKSEGTVSEDTFGSPIDSSDEKVVAAATTIQASFRGFQTRQNLKTTGKGEEQTEKLEIVSKESDFVQTNTTNETSPKVAENVLKIEPSESILENVDDKMISAATTIQANFRGFQTRQTLKSNVDSGLAPSEDTNQSVERRTPTALTPELIESVKEEVNDICKEAEVIAAERSESVEGMLRGVEHVVVGTKESALPSVSDSILAVRGSATPPSVSEAVDTDEAKEEVFDSLTDFDETTINAATTIQATFRGYQTRKALQDNTEQPDSMPDYPPPDEYLQSLEDLPPPDFEALESSYSEDVPTEPLVPPPPPDSEIFNEEDEDELVALQRPQECDELPEHRLTLDTESEPSDSSLSSAATKIQAGVRGYLTRKQIQTQGGTGTGTTSTSTNRTAPDSDGSLSVDGMRSAISTEEESEVTRHRATPDSEGASGGGDPRLGRTATKRMSLAEPPTRSHAPIRSRALSVQVAGPGPAVSDEEVWHTLKSEMADAATKIQSNFRGYRARKQLQREDAVQGTSSSSQATPTPTSGSVEAPPPQSQVTEQTEQRTSGEFHDIIALTPPHVDNPRGEGTAAAGSGEEAVADQPADAMVKRRASDEDAGAAAAATKIQATFRGFKTRQEMRDVDRAAAKIQAGFRGYKVRKEMKRNGEGGVRRSSNPEGAERHDPQTEKAATKIQAGVRGFLVRRRVQRGKSATQQ